MLNTISICRYDFIPLRAEASERSEMVSQILFGETYEVIDTQERWIKVRCDYDEYEGWMDAKLHTNIFPQDVEKWRNAEKWVVPGPFVKIIREGDRTPMIIPGGSSIWFNGSELDSFTINDDMYHLTGGYSANKKKPSIDEIALSFYSSPYLWGGRSFYGIDCSGFTQIVYKIAGHKIPRDASQQVNIGTIVDFVEEASVGDLAFFDNPATGNIVHVGMCLGHGEIIHASGSVRIDKLDHNGIFAADRNAYTHQLRAIKHIG